MYAGTDIYSLAPAQTALVWTQVPSSTCLWWQHSAHGWNIVIARGMVPPHAFDLLSTPLYSTSSWIMAILGWMAG